MVSFTEAAEKAVQDALAAKGLNCIARVREATDVTDFAIAASATRMFVIRCVARATLDDDYLTLGTMLQEGDFDRALLVHCGTPEQCRPSEVEACSIEELPEVLARWASEGAPS